MTTVNNINYIMAWLATSIYRPWYWQHHKRRAMQLSYRQRWLDVASRFTFPEIQDGLKKWALEHGVDCPPDPDAFAKFIAPKQSASSKQFFFNAKNTIGNHVDH